MSPPATSMAAQATSAAAAVSCITPALVRAVVLPTPICQHTRHRNTGEPAGPVTCSSDSSEV